MNHKYSTYVLLGLFALVFTLSIADALDGLGSVNYVPKFTYPGVLGNSSLIDDGTSPINVSTICTSTNGLCGSSSVSGNNKTFLKVAECGDVLCTRFIDSSEYR